MTTIAQSVGLVQGSAAIWHCSAFIAWTLQWLHGHVTAPYKLPYHYYHYYGPCLQLIVPLSYYYHQSLFTIIHNYHNRMFSKCKLAPHSLSDVGQCGYVIGSHQVRVVSQQVNGIRQNVVRQQCKYFTGWKQHKISITQGCKFILGGNFWKD